MQEQPFALIDDIPLEVAIAAHGNNSFSPEKWANQDREIIAAWLNDLHGSLRSLVVCPEQETIFAEELQSFKARYLAKEIEHLQARSRTASPMIVGPANFPTSRDDRARQRAARLLEELSQWKRKAITAIERKLRSAMPETVQQAELVAECERLIGDALDSIELGGCRDRAVNRICKITRGYAREQSLDAVRRSLQLVEEFNATHAKPAISKRHKFWQLASKMEVDQAKQQELESKGPRTIYEDAGTKIVMNFNADRLQILCKDKPTAEIRTRLKRSGWRWSGALKVWQRKLTMNALVSAEQILGVSVKR